MDIFQGGARLNTGPRSRSRQASVAGSNENLIDDKVGHEKQSYTSYKFSFKLFFQFSIKFSLLSSHKT